MSSLIHVYPEYSNDAYRILSLEDWPKAIKQKPNELTEAGFFYSGKGDKVLCFSCGGGLKDWEVLDIPWEQHALWYQNCQYLKIMKGQSYIDQVTSRKNEICVNQDNQESKVEKTEKEENKDTNGQLCMICCNEKYNMVFLPCGHVAVCSKCVFCF